MGALLHIRFPKPLANLLVQKFGEIYKINFAEAEKAPTEYASIGEFFVRRLKESARPLAEAAYVHPADSVISQSELIRNSSLIQAKGKTYPIQSFLKEPLESRRFENGIFATYYLCPTDYHRVHSPVAGLIKNVTYVPGALWPVNEWSVGRIDELFCVNERVVIEIETPQGVIAVVMVGATNVGKMSLSFEPGVLTNQGSSELHKITYNPAKAIQKGEELGMFHMGSTVVICADENLRKAYALDGLMGLKQKQVRVRAQI